MGAIGMLVGILEFCAFLIIIGMVVAAGLGADTGVSPHDLGNALFVVFLAAISWFAGLVAALDQ